MATVADPVSVAPGPMTPVPFRVSERVRETRDTWTLTLEPVAGMPPAVEPGQFVMVYAFGIGEVPISVSGALARPAPLVLTVRAVGAVTDAICRSVPGTVLGVRGPFGTAWPIAAAQGLDVVVIAGGIGLAPLRPVLLRALERRSDFGEVLLLYGARTPADVLYGDELERWRASASVAVTVDAADAGWPGRVGVVTSLVASADFAPAASVGFVCGPELMMRYAVAALLERGVPPARINVSLERNMRCGLGLCGHCQLGPTLVCRDGPVYGFDAAGPWLEVREL
jgi:NAD(P)H-flavin reductase